MRAGVEGRDLRLGEGTWAGVGLVHQEAAGIWGRAAQVPQVGEVCWVTRR